MSRVNLLYVGGLDESMSEELLHAAFIPFGDIKSVQIVRDYVASELRHTHNMCVSWCYVMCHINPS